ncbi:RNA 3'-terminal phosphate cyclase domain-containing protein [Phthorimaea operculella]|nr:RNA 3'-terminal phosphate cyclase domain-containing protein [Phthorimaea operculella]
MGIRWPDHSSKSPTGYRGSGMYCIDLETSGPTRRDPVLYGSVLSEVLQRFWESEEPPTADRRKPEDDECELFYQYNTARCPSGRFVTRLPFLPNRPALGWIKRFVNNCRKPQAERNFTPVLSPAERNAALCSLVRVVQAEHFEEEVRLLRDGLQIGGKEFENERMFQCREFRLFPIPVLLKYPEYLIPVILKLTKKRRHRSLVSELSSGCVLGADGLGKKEVAPLYVGKKAGEQMRLALESGACVDQHTQDQLIIYMALSSGRSAVRAGEVTLHTKTAIHIAEILTKTKFTITPCEAQNIIECTGIGFINRNLPPS